MNQVCPSSSSPSKVGKNIPASHNFAVPGAISLPVHLAAAQQAGEDATIYTGTARARRRLNLQNKAAEKLAASASASATEVMPVLPATSMPAPVKESSLGNTPVR